MAAVTRYAAAINALSLLSAVSAGASLEHGVCVKATTTVFETITIDGFWPDPSIVAASSGKAKTGKKSSTTVSQEYTCPATYTYSGVTFPTYSPEKLNPNGPYYNPNNYIPFTIDWPGKPTPGQTTVKPFPTSGGKPAGGYDASKYEAPAWQEVGKDLSPACPQSDTNGDSDWGLPNRPPLSRPTDGYISASATHGGEYSYSLTKSAGHSKPTSLSKSAGHSKPTSLSYSYGSYSSISKPSNGTSSASVYSPTSAISSASASTVSSASSSSSSSSVVQCKNKDVTEEICGPVPKTGVVRKYDFHVSYATIQPDGVKKNGLVVNNQFPGPLIEANWGDTIQVTVTNDLPADSIDQGEGTAIHWHGFLQQETPYYDGVPSVQQCPLAPGASLTYTFLADHIGTSWYHSHYSSQYAGGALGPIVIHGPTNECYDEDLGPVMVGDWYHADYFSVTQKVMAGGLPLSDNILINGKMNYPCENTTAACTPNAGLSKFKFTPGKKYLLRLINPSAEANIKFSIDNHNFTIIANDFQPIVPYETDLVTLSVGQRSDIIVEATGKEGDAFWMRATAGSFFTGGCALSSGVVTEGVAVVLYDGADENVVPTTTSVVEKSKYSQCWNDDLSLTSSLCKVPISDSFDVQEVAMTIGVTSTNASNGAVLWMINGVSFRGDYNVNLLEQVAEGNMTFKDEWNAYTFDSSASAIRLVISNAFFGPHPMHLHGHDFNVLAEGPGLTWDGTITNPSNTNVRDVQMVRAQGHLVLQFNRDNAGVWPFHCHIAWHVSQGLYMNIVENPKDIEHVPSPVQNTCREWAAWQAEGNTVNQIDSGLKKREYMAYHMS